MTQEMKNQKLKLSMEDVMESMKQAAIQQDAINKIGNDYIKNVYDGHIKEDVYDSYFSFPKERKSSGFDINAVAAVNNGSGGNGGGYGGGGSLAPWFAPMGKSIVQIDEELIKEQKKIIIYNEDQLKRMKQNVLNAVMTEIKTFEEECLAEMYQANIFDGLRAERSAVVKAVRRLHKHLTDKSEDLCKNY